MKAHRTKMLHSGNIHQRLTQRAKNKGREEKNLITFQLHDEVGRKKGKKNPLGEWKIISHYFIHDSEEKNEIGSRGALCRNISGGKRSCFGENTENPFKDLSKRIN